MELRVLRYFLTVAREENITRAAEVLHITQPALSRQLTALEDELNCQLLVRGNRKVSLTEAGTLLRRRAEDLVALADKTEREFAAGGQELAGEISIGTAESCASQMLPELLEPFIREHPLVRFDMVSGNADQIKDSLDQGLLDVGLLLEPVEVEKYEFLRLRQVERWGVLLRADDPLCEKDAVTPGDISCLPLLLSRRALVQKELASWFGEDFEQLHILSTYNLIGNAVHFVERGLGCAVTIEGAVSAFDPGRVCFRPLSPELNGRSVLIWKKYQTFNPLLTQFLNHARMTFGHGKI